MDSLDPRVNRLPEIHDTPPAASHPADQFGTFEVFVQPKVGKPFQHEGAVHAPNLELAYILAKETFTRRFTCISLYVVETVNIQISETTEGNVSVYDNLAPATPGPRQETSYEIFHLLKRGKQHIHAGTVLARSPHEAWFIAKASFNNTQVFNVWAIEQSAIRFTSKEEEDLWETLPDKKFRDAIDYKGGEKLKQYLEKAKPHG